ncbi:MAG: helix-turn-helix domain-containing protein, partial [Bryobacteraceae bacterium]
MLTPPEVGVWNATEEESQRPKRIANACRLTRVLDVAAAQFAMTWLHGTTTLALAKAAGISEPVLLGHFDSKEHLFRAAVEANIENRL